jgi:hypothetical protein
MAPAQRCIVQLCLRASPDMYMLCVPVRITTFATYHRPLDGDITATVLHTHTHTHTHTCTCCRAVLQPPACMQERQACMACYQQHAGVRSRARAYECTIHLSTISSRRIILHPCHRRRPQRPQDTLQCSQLVDAYAACARRAGGTAMG